MKAKEYYTQYKEKLKTERQSLVFMSILKQMFNEVKTIQLARKANTNQALNAIFKEMNQKCNAFTGLIKKDGGVPYKKDAFYGFIKIEMPAFYKLLMKK